jgi:ADP-heptose:LPS heptosyltransferase
MINVKYTKNIDYFIIYLLPYLEIYLNEHKDEKLNICSNEIICTIINLMFNDNIISQILKQNSCMLNQDVIELDSILSKNFDITKQWKLTKPIIPTNNLKMNNKKYVCIFPKFKVGDNSNNITKTKLNELVQNTELKNSEIYIIGDQFERLNIKMGKDIDNIMDTLECLKYCKIFITSESYWHYIALLCNCKNILVYSEKENKRDIHYCPFNNNIKIVNNINCNETYKFINECMRF